MLRLLKRGFFAVCIALILGITMHEAKAIEPKDFDKITPERMGVCGYYNQPHYCIAAMYQGDLYLIIGPKDADEEVTVYAIYKLDAESSKKMFAGEFFDFTNQDLVWKKGAGI